jgi:hypothetical protein
MVRGAWLALAVVTLPPLVFTVARPRAALLER